jgi:hypothetical protein
MNVTSVSVGTINVSGVSDIYSGTFAGANDINIAADITPLFFDAEIYRSFVVQVSVGVSATSSLYEQTLIEGIQTASGWYIYTSEIGDDVDFIFSITNAGQLQYTSANYPGWTDTTLKYQVTALRK